MEKGTRSKKDQDWQNVEDSDPEKEYSKKAKNIKIVTVFATAFLLCVVFFASFFAESIFPEEDTGNNDGNGNIEAPQDTRESTLGEESQDTVFQRNYDSVDLPVTKPDYARHESSLINEGISEYMIRCHGRMVIDEGHEYESEDIEAEYIEPVDANHEVCNMSSSDDSLVGSSIQDLNDSAQIRSLLEANVDEEVAFLSQHFSRRIDGYTNNPADAFEEDGTTNPYYSFVLGDDINFFFAHHVERLINPHYGEWAEFQHSESNASENFSGYLFRDLFTEEWWTENVGRFASDSDYASLPIFADWNEDDYRAVLDEAGIDEELTDETIRWVGEIEDYSFDYYEVAEGRSFGIDVNLDVNYTAKTSENGTVSLPAELDIGIVPNYDNPDLPLYRLVIAEAQMRIN